MKTYLIILLIIPVFVFSQTTEELDFIAPFNDGVAAVKKGNTWGFIDNKGNITIPFREDLVLTEINGSEYPVFKNNHCIISEKKDGISYYGYIDMSGKTVIKPKFLNALNFDNDQALVLALIKQEVGKNDVLEKQVVFYKYFEVIVDANGSIKHYLNPKGIPIILDKKYLSSPPIITSKFISNSLVSTLNENKKRVIKSINL